MYGTYIIECTATALYVLQLCTVHSANLPIPRYSAKLPFCPEHCVQVVFRLEGWPEGGKRSWWSISYPLARAFQVEGSTVGTLEGTMPNTPPDGHPGQAINLLNPCLQVVIRGFYFFYNKNIMVWSTCPLKLWEIFLQVEDSKVGTLQETISNAHHPSRFVNILSPSTNL
jgi:hypothetical protein